MPWQLIAVALFALAVFAGSYLVKPPFLGRSFRTVVLLCMAAFCAFGFLASFEYPGITTAKIVYCILGAAAVASAVLPWLMQSRTTAT